MKSQILLFITIVALTACQQTPKEKETTPDPTKNELGFEQRKIVDSTEHWWAHCPVEITGDGIVDLVFIHKNSSGGYLAYYEGQQDTGLWKLNIIAEAPPTGGLFAAGDLECADMDGDGDIDVLGVKHPGEWIDASAPAEIFWYENPGWEPHTIGTVPDAVKDVSFGDFDQDGKMDLAVLTFDENTLSIFQQKSADEWERVQFLENYGNLHEGMAIGDVNGDDLVDIVANGWFFQNPGKKLSDRWAVEGLSAKWHNQEGDWSRNATKAFMRDLNNDGRMEVFMSHSERAGYPLVWYHRTGVDMWEEHVIADSIAACHTLQVYDFDLDGDYDVLAGVNYARAVNINQDKFPVTIYLSSDNYQTWTPMVIETNGIYNGQAADYDGDGDVDVFRYPNHEAKSYYLLENKVIQ